MDHRRAGGSAPISGRVLASTYAHKAARGDLSFGDQLRRDEHQKFVTHLIARQPTAKWGGVFRLRQPWNSVLIRGIFKRGNSAD